jgi:hypothetical protein
MSQTLITGQELTRAALDIFHNNVVITRNMDLQYEPDFGSQTGYDGQKIGPTLQIRKPPIGTVRSTWAMSQQDMTETYASLTVDTVRGIDLNFPDADLALSVDDFVKRYIEPNVKRLASEVDKVSGAWIKNHTSRLTGLGGTQPNAISYFLNAKRKLNDQTVPQDGDIACIVCPATEAAMIGGLTPLQFNPQAELSEMFKTGKISNMAGMNWYMSQILTAHTCGSRTETTPVASAIVTQGQSTMTITGLNATSFTEGDIFTVAGCYDCNPETKQTLPYLKQFRVTSTVTATATTTNLPIAPSVYFSSAAGYLQNCSAFPGGAVSDINDATHFGSGTASYTYSNDLVFHKKAFAFASAPLIIPNGVDMAGRASADGFSVRFVRAYDTLNARMLNRLDIFFGLADLRPEWSCRVIGVGA